MTIQSHAYEAALFLSATSLFLALVSLVLGTRVYYLDYLSFFNALALAIVVSGAGGVFFSLAGAIQSRGRSLSSWMSLGMALFVLTAVLFDS